jgi:hypothetical protein
MAVKGLTPILNVSDIAGTFAWFEKWGWKKLSDWGTPPTMHLRHPDGHVFRVGRGFEPERQKS